MGPTRATSSATSMVVVLLIMLFATALIFAWQAAESEEQATVAQPTIPANTAARINSPPQAAQDGVDAQTVTAEDADSAVNSDAVGSTTGNADEGVPEPTVDAPEDGAANGEIAAQGAAVAQNQRADPIEAIVARDNRLLNYGRLFGPDSPLTDQPVVQLFETGELTATVERIFGPEEEDIFLQGGDTFVIGPDPVIRASTMSRLIFVDAAAGRVVGLVHDVLLDAQGAIQYLVVATQMTEATLPRARWYVIPWALFDVVAEPAADDIVSNYVFVFTGTQADVLASEIIEPEDLVAHGLFVDPGDLNLATGGAPLLRAAAFADAFYPLINVEDEWLAMVEDLVLNLEAGGANWAIIRTPDGWTAVPLELLTFNEPEEQLVTVLRAETLHDAPPIAVREWFAPFEPNFDEAISLFWAAVVTPPAEEEGAGTE